MGTRRRSSVGRVRAEHLELGLSQPRAQRSSPAAWCLAHQILRQFYSKKVPPLELSFILTVWSSSASKM